MSDYDHRQDMICAALSLARKLASEAGEELDYFLAHPGLWPIEGDER